MIRFRRRCTAAMAVAICLFITTGCGAVKTTFDVVGGTANLTFGAAKATVGLAQGGVRVAQGGIEVAKGAADLGVGAGRSALDLTQQGFQTAGSAVRLVDQVDEAGHRGRMRRLAEERAASAGR